MPVKTNDTDVPPDPARSPALLYLRCVHAPRTHESQVTVTETLLAYSAGPLLYEEKQSIHCIWKEKLLWNRQTQQLVVELMRHFYVSVRPTLDFSIECKKVAQSERHLLRNREAERRRCIFWECIVFVKYSNTWLFKSYPRARFCISLPLLCLISLISLFLHNLFYERKKTDSKRTEWEHLAI